MIKNVILDTDMGVDCDDCVALALLLKKHLKGEVNLLCVTASSTRQGATATIKAISDYYNVNVEIGAMAMPKLSCDDINSYASAVMQKYGVKDSEVDAVRLIRKKLVTASDKVVFIAVGPLVNVSRFLKSEGDDISPKTGAQLAKEKISALYVMGGSFIENYKFLSNPQTEFIAEWNILQDVKSAQHVSKTFPSKIYYVPWEAGFEVYTKKGCGENPVWFGMAKHAEALGVKVEGYCRDSWDPITCLCATQDCSEFFDFAPLQKIVIDDNGFTKYLPGNGMASYLVLKEGYKNVANVINDNLIND